PARAAPLRPGPPAGAGGRGLDGRLSRAAREEGLRGKSDQTFVFHTHGRLAAERVVVAGLGPAAQRDGEALRQAAGRGVKAAQRLRAKTVTIAVPAADGAGAGQAAARGGALGAYRFERR